MTLARSHAANDTEQRIRAARQLLKPSEVRLHHVPNWFRRALLKAYGCPRHDTSGHAVLYHAASNDRDWLDHWGSTQIDGKAAFVSEPYGLSAESMAAAAELATKAGCRFYVSPNAWWYPGATIRLVFEQRTEGTR